MSNKHLSRLSTLPQTGNDVDKERSPKAQDAAYEALLGSVPYPVLVLNADQQVSYINPAFVRVFGWSLGELKQEPETFVPINLREDARQLHRQLCTKKALKGVEVKRLAKDGRILDVMLDGAVIIQNNQVLAAGCMLPLSEGEYSYTHGTRHRAAIGITEETDAISIIVSEERGAISVSYNGVLKENLSLDDLEIFLAESLKS